MLVSRESRESVNFRRYPASTGVHTSCVWLAGQSHSPGQLHF